MADKNKKSEGITGSGDKKAVDNQISSTMPTISIPKGGGAIRGIGEKFGVNPVTGTGSLSVPIFTSPGRSGFGPQLSLSYDSGSGNGPFGFGWSLSLPSITRKTDKGLPRYLDADESDIFILSGAEDLVPVLIFGNGEWKRDSFDSEDKIFSIQRYRPRVEGLFARIERWTRKIDGDVHWRSISKDNVLTVYGWDEKSRIFDPSDNSRVFSWLICESYDDKGDAILYKYVAEDEKKIDLSQANERNRLRTTNRYLKRILYGNRKPLLLDITRPSFRKPHTKQEDFSADWMFELVFDYGDHDTDSPKPDDDTAKDAEGLLKYPWMSRPDSFSSYRAGFEIRTYRLCHRVLMFHHFKGEEDVGNDCLVRSTDLFYTEDKKPEQACSPVYTFLKKVIQFGYKRDKGSYLKRRLPPVEFEYSQPMVQDSVEAVDLANLENLPIGLDGKIYQWIDLHGEGIPGILTEQGGAWFYKRNMSPINIKSKEGVMQTEPKFGSVELVALKPNLALAAGAQFMDLAGDGQPDLVIMDGPVPGLYEHDDHEGWQNFRAFLARLNRDTKDSNLKLVDLDGDGHADVLITEGDAFIWHVSLAEEGFGSAQRVYQALDEEKGPRLVFADGTQSVYLADISGDGLTDLVRIRNGEICYWPNLGYGRFGAKVTMDHSPYFDNPDQFDQKRIRLADIDGTGTTDIIYLHRDGVRLYFNQSGNSWSEPRYLKVFPRVDDLVSIMPIDLLGNGTACLVWSSPLPGDAGRQMRYVNLMGGEKPHLLVKTINNLGAETRIHYAPSTKFYLQDKRDGQPWITRLPFPVHVVERVETYDRISRNLFVTRYAYHHGYFDGEEREFRGFGKVEQWDTEEIGDIEPDKIEPDNTNWDDASFVPPVLTKTWFHTGAYFEDGRISKHFEEEYYHEGDPSRHEGQLGQGDLEAMLLPDTVLPGNLTAEESREACRSLKGSILRQEVYALDRRPDGTLSEESDRPYTVSERNYTVERLQPMGENRHAVFFVHPRETIDFNYEREFYKIDNNNVVDPRVSHQMVLKVDNFGNVERSVAIGYPRRDVPDRHPEQAITHITLTVNRFINSPELIIKFPKLYNSEDLLEWYRTGLPSEAQTYEIVKPPEPAVASTSLALLKFDDICALTEGLFPLNKTEPDTSKTFPYEKWDWRNDPKTPNELRLRPIERVRTIYRKNDLTGFLLLDQIDSLALPGETYRLAFTLGLLEEVYQRKHDGNSENLIPDPSAVLESKGKDGCGYVDLDKNGHWWIPSGLVFYSPNKTDTPPQELDYARQHFFLPHRYRDPFHTDGFSTETSISYDPYDLLLQETCDALDNRVTVGERDTSGKLTASGNDYRVLQPRLVMDPNRNCSEVAFDALGLVVGTAVKGKPEDKPQKGDQLKTTFKADLTQDEIKGFFDNPKGPIAALLLDSATTRIIYDLTAYCREPDVKKKPPAFAATLARETHVSDPIQVKDLKIQVSFSYSDGFGREIQKKIQAEPGPVPKRENGKIVVDANGQPVMTDYSVSPRWVGSGWTVFNNKGKPVRQYEPFFTDRHQFEFEIKIGVSPVLFYDPVERVIATLHPNGTFEKVVFDPWHQKTYDVNDTVTFDPRTDEDISGYVAGYFKQEAPQPDDWKTWLTQRGIDPLNPPQDSPQLDPEKKAAIRTLMHADTPTIAYFDSLGRTFLTVAHNKFRSRIKGGYKEVDEKHRTRIEFDIEGNQRAVRDEIKKDPNLPHDPQNLEERIVMLYDYGMLGNRIHQKSMEAGERWMLNDVTGKPLRTWDSRGHNFRIEYDELRRPVRQFAKGTDAKCSDPGTLKDKYILFEKTEYGEGQSKDMELNLRTRVFKQYDGAGIVTNIEYDFKGNLLQSQRQLAKDYDKTLDWLASPEPEDETFSSSATYDALNRPVELTAPHSNNGGKINKIRHIYNEANLLERVEANLQGATEITTFVENIDYNAKGQRTMIVYGSGASHGNPDPKDDREGVTTTYTYDPLTFRLTHLLTIRDKRSYPDDCPKSPLTDWPGCQLQNLHYTYDPAGNITYIKDDAQQTIFFKGRWVEPSNEYTYDAIYRLIEATGREHLGQVGGAPQPHSYNDSPRVGLEWSANDGNLMGTYLECFLYDAVGNILEVKHRGCNPSNPGWTRGYSYNEESQIERGLKNNRLSSTTIGDAVDRYKHDEHGNIIYMPHLANYPDKVNPNPNMHWDYKDQLHQVDMANGSPIYYIYDSTGQRVRKAFKNSPGLEEERIYIGDFEIFRQYNVDGAVTLERETLHIMDDKQRIALVETRTKGNDHGLEKLKRYQFSNHLGSATLELDDMAQVITYEEYYPYGSTSYQAVRNQTETTKRYRYTGKERDEECGFYYYGARYYASWLGRWISADPIGIADSLNSFQYASSSPMQWIDLKGTKVENWQKIPSADAALTNLKNWEESCVNKICPLPEGWNVIGTKEVYSHTETYAGGLISESKYKEVAKLDYVLGWYNFGEQEGKSWPIPALRLVKASANVWIEAFLGNDLGQYKWEKMGTYTPGMGLWIGPSGKANPSMSPFDFISPSSVVGAGRTLAGIGSKVLFHLQRRIIINPNTLNSGLAFALESAAKAAKRLRRIPGVASGEGGPLPPSGSLIDPTGHFGNIPTSIASRLRGRYFESWKDFRETFWKEIAESKFANQFSRANRVLMRKGYAPWSIKGKFELHHHGVGGWEATGLYNMDAIKIVSESGLHDWIHYFGGKLWR